MKLLKNIEDKIKLATTISIGSFLLSLIIVGVTFFFAYRIVKNSQDQIYVLSNNVPLEATKKHVEDNRLEEYKSTIDLFHNYFFTLTPDEAFIDRQVKKAIYLIDQSGVAQFNTLKEKAFYSRLVQTNTIQTVTTDSIAFNPQNKRWIYYGKVKIDRPSNTVIRSLVTEGFLQDVQRSSNNPHGVQLIRWKTIENRDLKNTPKNAF